LTSMYEDLRMRLLIGQFSMVLYSAVLAFLGRSGKAFLLAFILIILFSVAMSRFTSKKGPLRRVKPEEVLQGRVLYEEKSTREIQTSDRDLVMDIQEQSKFSMYNMVGMLAAMAYFFLLWPYIDVIYEAVAARVGEGTLAHFIAYLIYFEGLFVITQVSYWWALRKVGKIKMIQMPQSYKVTEKGIVLQGLVGKSAIAFPLPREARVEVNEKRKFVEIVVEGKRSVTRLRLYARNPRRLFDILKRGSSR